MFPSSDHKILAPIELKDEGMKLEAHARGAKLMGGDSNVVNTNSKVFEAMDVVNLNLERF